MTEQPEQDLTPEQEADVRRLLADARHTEPVPDAVVARLDRVLAGLADEPARSADVVRLSDRRRKAGTILIAAAASVVAVLGTGQLISNTGGGAAEYATSGDADAGAEPEAAEAPEHQSGEGALGAGRGSVEEDYRLAFKRRPYALKSDDFARDADVLQLEALASAAADEAGGQGAPTFAGSSLDRVQNRTVCEPGAWGGGSYVAVLYDGAEGWVVLRRPRGETQIADLFLCGSESAVRSVTLPYP